MLGKLIKYELKATARILLPFYFVLLCISIINRFLYQPGINYGIHGFFNGILILAQITLIIGVLATTVLFIIVRFYKNLMTDEGYLMFTLPVNSHQLILSKLIVSLFWLLISIVIIVLSLYLVFATSGSMNSIINIIQNSISELSAITGTNGIVLFTELFALIFISVVSNVLLFYTSIAIGHLFSKHKIIASFVSYAIIYNIIQIILVLILIVTSYLSSGKIDFVNRIPQTIFIIGIIISSLTSVAFYLTTNYIFKRKLNLN